MSSQGEKVKNERRRDTFLRTDVEGQSRGVEWWLQRRQSTHQEGTVIRRKNDRVHKLKLRIKGNYIAQLMSHFSKL